MSGVTDSEPPASPTAQTPPTDPGDAGRPQRRRGMGSARSMIISMVLVALAVLAWWAFVPRAEQTTQPTVDVAGIAREVGRAKHWDPAIAQGLPKGWQPVNVRLVSVDKQPDTWQAGYDAPGGCYARAVQTQDGTSDWVAAQTDQSTRTGSVTLAGVRWTQLTRADGGERSLVRSRPLAGLSTVVTGTCDWGRLHRFAESLQPLSKSQLSPAPSTP